MTVGQRIAQKRKELGLSQEALGEQLGVSRQAIYKWESDATLPEIEKLISLSRSFGVSVGWLLGVEEDPVETNGTNDSGELTEAQLQMVKEIVDGYLAAQPAPEPPKKRRWPKVLAAAACVILVVVLANLFNRLDSLNNQYSSLQNSISNIQSNVSVQVNSIAGRVEEILKSQNDLTADYSTEVVSVDPAANMATFAWRVVPKTYQPGMQAWIDIENGEAARITYGPYDPVQEVFSGEFTVALTDSTKIYVVFEYGGTRQTQLLDTHEYLLSSSYPSVWLDAWPLFFDVDDETNTLTDDLYADLTQEDDGLYSAQVADYRVGLFADQTLVAWFTPITRDIVLNGVQTQEEVHFLSREGIVFDRDKEYCIAAVVADEYGREFIISDTPMCWTDSGWSNLGSYSSGPFFEGWTY